MPALIFPYSCICSKIVELMLQNYRAQWQVAKKQRAICCPWRTVHLLLLSTKQTMGPSTWMGSRSNPTQPFWCIISNYENLQAGFSENLSNSCELGIGQDECILTLNFLRARNILQSIILVPKTDKVLYVKRVVKTLLASIECIIKMFQSAN